MNTVLAILLFVLKLIGALLLFALALVLLVSLLPIGAHIVYRPDTLTVDAVLGPVRRRFMTRRLGGPKTAKAKPAAKQEPPPVPAPEQTAAPTAPAAPAAAAKPAAARKSKPKPGKSAPAPAPAEAGPASPGFVDRLLAAARRDPVTFIERVVTHALFAGGSLLHGVRVTDLWVYWTVHTEEAVHTALLYGSLMAALNNALVRLKEQMTVRPEELWLEPDYTGELAPRRHIEASVTMRPIVLLVLAPRLLWRLWCDRAFAGVFPFTKAPETLDTAS